MKRLNRKKLIIELEGLRQGFRDASSLYPRGEDKRINEIFEFTMKAYHEGVDRLIVELGGESIFNEDVEP